MRCTRFCHRQLFQQAAELHDECDLAGRKDLADAHRCDQRQRYEHVGLDIKHRHEPDDCLQHDRHAAQYDCDPRQVERERLPLEQTAHERNAANGQQRDAFLRPAQLQKLLEFFHKCFHGFASLIPLGV